MKQNKFFKICKPYYFILVILSIYNLTNTSGVFLHNAMIYGHYSTLLPNTLLFIYLYYAANKINALKNDIITRIGEESYYRGKKQILLTASVIYLIFFYIINFALYPLPADYPVIMLEAFVFLNTLQIVLGTVMIMEFEKKVQGFFGAMLLNLSFHYVVVTVFFPLIEEIIL